MGLLLSDTVLLDPLLDETLRLRDGLGAWAFGPDVASEVYEHEAADPSEGNGPFQQPAPLPVSPVKGWVGVAAGHERRPIGKPGSVSIVRRSRFPPAPG